MIAVIKKDEGSYPMLININSIAYSYKREGGYGLIMEGSKSEVWLTYKEFDQLVDAIAKEKT